MLTHPEKLRAKDLALTPRGLDWVSQFGPQDRETARALLGTLTLVSHSTFERAINKLIRECAARINGPVALFAVRELDKKDTRSLFKQAASVSDDELNAVGGGADLGSEARVAAIIRELAKSDQKKFLNHPSISKMRAEKCGAIFMVDDLIGSGTRTTSFVDAIWRSLTIRAWKSRGYIRLEVIAYSGIISGKRKTASHRSRPIINVEKDCPSLFSLPWYKEKKVELINLCNGYGGQTSRPKLALGYSQTGALLVFEHGCPNNAPAIIWAPSTPKKNWMPLFPDRTVLLNEKSAFPIEIARRDPVKILVEAGLSHLLSLKSSFPLRPSPLAAEMIIILGLISKNITEPASLSFATGLSNNECTEMLENCISWGLITTTFRLTQLARNELISLKAPSVVFGPLPSLGEEEYYPQSLRSHSGG